MKIAMGADHGGYELKNIIKKHLEEKGIEVIDCGTNGPEAVDYPVYGKAAALKVKNGEADLGILVCGTGIGIGYSANKIPGIRCALLSDVFSAKATREHNNSNMMSLGARVTGPGLALEIVDAFISTPFSEAERHQNRIDMLTEIEKEYSR